MSVHLGQNDPFADYVVDRLENLKRNVTFFLLIARGIRYNRIPFESSFPVIFRFQRERRLPAISRILMYSMFLSRKLVVLYCSKVMWFFRVSTTKLFYFDILLVRPAQHPNMYTTLSSIRE